MERLTEMTERRPPVAGEESARARARARRVYVGLAIGIVLGFAVTGLYVARFGYNKVQITLVGNLIWVPLLGVGIAFALGRRGESNPWKWRFPRLGTRALMAVVAYVALLFGMGVSTYKLGNAAERYYHKSLRCGEHVKFYRIVGLRSATVAASSRANVAGLRAGKIPEGLFEGQGDFLRSLEEDPKVTPEFRKYRRDLITNGHEENRISNERHADLCRRLADYSAALSLKYERARWRPWLPVAPDPPPPE